MRAIWTGAIGFGLVNIPVKLYSASQESTLDLDMLDKKDHSKIRFQRINESTGKEVPWKNIVKAYKLQGDYVVLDEKDFASANPEKRKIISITSFVDVNEVDSIYFETPYFLEPDKAGEKPYRLLHDALEKSGKAGLGSFVLRSKEHLCLIKPHEDILDFKPYKVCRRDPQRFGTQRTKKRKTDYSRNEDGPYSYRPVNGAIRHRKI